MGEIRGFVKFELNYELNVESKYLGMSNELIDIYIYIYIYI